MMTNLLSRLRAAPPFDPENRTKGDSIYQLCGAAADEIETVHEQLRNAMDQVQSLCEQNERLSSVASAEMKLREGNFAEIERLQTSLARCLRQMKTCYDNSENGTVCECGDEWHETHRQAIEALKVEPETPK